MYNQIIFREGKSSIFKIKKSKFQKLKSAFLVFLVLFQAISGIFLFSNVQNAQAAASTVDTNYYRASINADGSLTFLNKDTGALILNSSPRYDLNYGAVNSTDKSPANSSFETDANGDNIPDNWTIDKSYVQLSTEQVNNGKKSLKFNMASSDTDNRRAYSSLISVTQGDTYTVSLSSYISSIANISNSDVYVSYYTTANGTGTQYLSSPVGIEVHSSPEYMIPYSKTGSWNNTSYTWTPPAEAKSFKVLILLHRDASGVVYFDNLSVTENVPIYTTNGNVASTVTTSGNTSVITSTDNTNPYVTVTNRYELKTDSPSVKYTATLAYKQNVTVSEERFDFDVPTQSAQVMTRDLKLNSFNTTQSYWSDLYTPKVVKFNSGLSFLGDDTMDAMRLEASGADSLVSFYSDYNLDHPHFSRVDHGGGAITYMSGNKRSAGDTYSSSVTFNINPSSAIKSLVKTRQPYGYDTVLNFTNHPDSETTANIKAVAYGSEDSTDPTYGTKGIVGRGLGFTRGIFVSGNAGADLDSAAFKTLTDQMYKDGVEIVGHTITPNADDRTTVANGLQALSRYGANDWIDHGSGSGVDNFEDLDFNGVVKSSSNYTLDLLDQYNYGYAWAYLDVNSPDYGALNMLQPASTSDVRPFLFYNNQVDNNVSDNKKIYLWATKNTSNAAEAFYTNANVDSLISERGVDIGHDYLGAPTRNNHTFYTNPATGKVEIYPAFDNELAYIEQKKEAGLIWSPTVKTWGDYLIALKDVEVIYNSNGTYTVTNNSASSITGVTLLAENDLQSVTIDGKALVSFGGSFGSKELVLPTLAAGASATLAIVYGVKDASIPVITSNDTGKSKVNEITGVYDSSNKTLTITEEGSSAARSSTATAADFANQSFDVQDTSLGNDIGIYKASGSGQITFSATLGSLHTFVISPQSPQSTVATPTFSLAAGSYTSVQTVSISTATAGSTIYYTTDGSIPTASSAVYTAPVTVSSSETIKVFATHSDMTDSGLAISTYSINPWYNTSYNYRKVLTIDHTKVANTDQSNFPVLVSLTDNSLKAVLNGGKVQNMNGYDIIFTSSDGSTKLSHEIESYDGATGTIRMWVKVPTLSHTADTLIQMYYGNNNIAFSEEDKTNVWDSSYQAVWHMDEAGTASASDYKDSTLNANNGGDTAYEPSVNTSGKIGNGQSFDGTSQRITVPSSSSISPASSFTLESWINTGSGNRSIFEKIGSHYNYQLQVQGAVAVFKIYDGTSYPNVASASAVVDGTWHHIVAVRDAVAHTLTMYVDGAQSGQAVDSTTGVITNTSTAYVGARGDLNATSFFSGSLDEMRVSSSARSADWIATEYSNENTPSSFMSEGSEDVYKVQTSTVATPTFSPAAGTYSSAQNVTISTATTGADIYYTVDGTTPTVSSTQYAGTITVSSTETVKAVAIKSGYINSDVASAAYTINTPVVATPTFSPAGGIYTSAQSVTISTTTPSTTIYYTTDGTIPTESSSVYSLPINVAASETINAIASAIGMTNSLVGSAAYTISIPVVATPTFSPAGGTYNSAQSVTISSATAGSTIYYTTDGTDPTASSLIYVSPVNVSSSKTIKAIAVKAGCADSAIANAAYTINPWYNASYLYRKALTIDHTKVANTDQSNFPVLVSFVDNALKSVLNGGKVRSASGYDIIFTNADDTTKLSHEIESYDASTGTIKMWVKIPNLSHTTDTLIHMYYGNSTIAFSQEDRSNVWDGNFKAVWHLKETGSGSASDYKDSTSNANNGGNATYEPTFSVSGKVDGAQSFNGTSQRIAVPSSSSLSPAGSFSIEGWINTGTGNKSIFEKIGSKYNFQLQVNSQKAVFKVYDGTNYPSVASSATVVNSVWHHIVAVRDNVAHKLTVYVDGVLSGQVADTTTGVITNTSIAYIGARGDLNASYFFKGSLDEMRVSSSVRSADWIATEYSNENSPSSFMIEGGETSQS